MTRINFLSLALIALVACSKSSAPAPVVAATVGCTITFKGTSYPLTSATCSTVGTEQYLTGVNTANPTTSPNLNLGKGTGAGDYITFFTNVGDPNTLYSSVGLGTAPSVTIAGKTWTFSGTLQNSANSSDSGTITGTCTCGM